MICIQSITELLLSLLDDFWKISPRPESNEICFPDTQLFVDSAEITEWLKNKSNTNFMNDGEFQTYMPFFYFTDKSKVYFSLGYLLKILQILRSERQDLSVDFGCYHFLTFLRENNFKNLENLYETQQRQFIYAVLELISLSGVKEFDDLS
jgi:hypothetical protein